MTLPTLAPPEQRQLERWQNDFLQLNQRRLDRARDLLSLRHQHILNLIPVLLHTNHQSLPGFQDHHTPCGIDHFRITNAAEQAARHLLPVVPRLNLRTRSQQYIGGIYLMGSIGSLAQTPDSDFDIWVCLNQPLNEADLQRLQQKCQKIEKWAARDRLELHFFIMDLEQFRDGQQRAAEGEDCGTSQHLLLLDEFYRSAIWLAGRFPRWWLIPASLEMRHSEADDVQRYWRRLIDESLIQPDQWLDFGTLSKIPANEFLGAALWQLSKSLSGPYKALLKLLLYRCYASEYPDTRPLCHDLKQRVHQGETDPSQADAYLLLLQRLMTLPELTDERIDLIRRAFYFKTHGRLSKTPRSEHQWRHTELRALADDWQWSPETLQQLDDHRNWPPQLVFRERNDLVKELLSSYRQLRHFSDRHAGDVRISQQDIRSLGNQLEAAMDARPGKIVRINPGISPSLIQHQITLIRYPGVWQLAPGYWHEPPPDHEILRQSQSLVELLAFAELNGLIGRDTRVDCYPSNAISRHELKQTLTAVRQQMQDATAPTDWMESPCITHIEVFLNCSIDPLAELSKAGLQKVTDRDDILCFSASRSSLVSSADILTRNSWNEWHVEHLHGARCFNSLMTRLLAQLVDRTQRPAFELHCFSPTRASQIRHRVLQLMSNAIGNRRRYGASALYQLGTERCALFPDEDSHAARDNPLHWKVDNLNDDGRFWKHLARPRQDYQPVMADRFCALTFPLNAMMEKCRPAHWQLFYQQNGQQLTFYLVDGHAAMVRHRIERSQLKFWLLPTLRFLLQLRQRWYGDSDLSLFELVEHQHLHPVYKSRRTDWEIHTRGIPQTAHQPPAIELTAYIDRERQPTLYCNHQEFSIWQHGEQLYQQLHQRIMTARNSTSRYPCYLSDLIIEGDQQQDLLRHWQHKLTQEDAINQAIP